MERQELEECLRAPFSGLNITALISNPYISILLVEIQCLCLKYGQVIRVVREKQQIKVYCAETNALLWFLKRSKG